MKIRIATTMPIQPFRDDPIWNARTIDEFVELFVRGNMLIIGELQVQISNFTKHNEYIATFNVEHVEMEPDIKDAGMCPYRYTHLEMLLALDAYNAPPNRRSRHNIKISHIPDDYNPLKNPRAEAARRSSSP